MARAWRGLLVLFGLGAGVARAWRRRVAGWACDPWYFSSNRRPQVQRPTRKIRQLTCCRASSEKRGVQ
eukprot:gene10614-biopygen4792